MTQTKEALFKPYIIELEGGIPRISISIEDCKKLLDEYAVIQETKYREALEEIQTLLASRTHSYKEYTVYKVQQIAKEALK